LNNFPAILRRSAFLAAAVFIIWTVLYKVNDPDFWWHLKAGDVFLRTGWIATDVFAHTREGLPYLATHGWLAEIMLSIFWKLGGSTAVILLRISLALLSFFVLLALDTKRIWPNALLVMLAAVSTKGAWQDRPQLWTYACFSLALYFTIQFAFSPNKREEMRTNNLYKYAALLVCIQWLWANMHGGASLVMFALVGAAFLQIAWEWFRSGGKNTSTLFVLLISLLGMCVAFFLTPNGIHNIQYVKDLFSDQTAQFIREWSPPGIEKYITQLGFFWVTAVASIIAGKRKLLFSWLALLTFGVLAATAVRHMPLFVFTAVGITIWQLKGCTPWQTLMHSTVEKRERAFQLSVVGTTLAVLLYLPAYRTIAHAGLSGFGQYEPYSAAYDFVENSRLSGNMFNTYGMGGYLLYRGYPERKVFVDGRNIDYGYEFLSKTLSAAQDEAFWKELEDTYNLSYALISYQPKGQQWEQYPYTSLLDTNPNWNLVYLDEAVAVYAKNTKENLAVRTNYSYEVLTPERLHKMDVFEHVLGQEQVHALERDLLRTSTQSKGDTAGLLLLADLYASSGLTEDLKTVLAEARNRKPKDALVRKYMKKYL
jgi:hypothetical protein